jgi:hypothetical protein
MQVLLMQVLSPAQLLVDATQIVVSGGRTRTRSRDSCRMRLPAVTARDPLIADPG